MSTIRTYTTAEVEAAMCLWEAFLEHEDGCALMRTYRDEVGTVVTRHDLMRFVAVCIAEWEALTEDERDAFIPYDWEWCPYFIKNRLDWSQPGALRLIPKTQKVTEEEIRETAMCLWEAVLENRRVSKIDRLFDHLGTAELRRQVASLASACDAEWYAMTDDQREDFGAFGWEWCPFFVLSRIDWTGDALKLLPKVYAQ